MTQASLLAMASQIARALKERNICKLDDWLSEDVRVQQVDGTWDTKYEWIDKVQNREIQYISLAPVVALVSSHQLETGTVWFSGQMKCEGLAVIEVELTLRLQKRQCWTVIQSSVKPINEI